MIRLFLLVVLCISVLPSVALPCGYDPCDDNPCLGYREPCASPEYIDDVYGARSNFLLLIGSYFPEPQGAIRARWEKWDDLNRRYRDDVNGLLKAQGLSPLELERIYESYLYSSDPCRSNTFETAVSFLKAASSDPVAAPSLAGLADARHRILNLCGYRKEQASGALELIEDLKKNKGSSPHAGYLEAIYYFYNGEYGTALKHFQKLAETTDGWLRETSLYMTGRTNLIISQDNWPGWGSLDSIDKEILDRAETAYNTYLAEYPNGIYESSARNIKRRIMFLRQERDALNEALTASLKNAIATGSAPAVRKAANEIFYYYDSNSVTTGQPFITAFELLRGNQPTPEAFAALEKNSRAYKPYPGLHKFVLNLARYRMQDHDGIIAKNKGKEFKDNAVDTASYILLARAFEKTGRFKDARKVWLDMASRSGKGDDHFVSVSISRNYLATGDIEAMAMPESNITDRRLMRNVFETLASDDLLEKIAFQTDATPSTVEDTRDVLLQRLLLKKDYARFLKVLDRLKEPGIYAQVETAARMLLKDSTDPTGLLNAGYFIYYHGIGLPNCWGTAVREYGKQNPVDFDPDGIEPPFFYFKKALEQFKASDKSDVEAKLLHYLIISFKQSLKAINSTWHKVPKSENRGKEWFELLHRKYPDSKWAKETPYYY